MNPIDKVPLWLLISAVVIIAGIPAVTLLVEGHLSAACLTLLSVSYSVALGRATLRRELIARGVQIEK
ncbi:hypothetical protein [Catellatospora sichuanensis]|uniref:hypothetical protein n=1 Tax=Catellatospora sichuanensis TaxID=1969805 RepID=UPI0011834583|nr:hypothetical protein [Catellatospora sichuanensis]